MLSTEAGAYDELHEAADGIHPFDLLATACRARRRRSTATATSVACVPEQLRRLVERRTPADWLADQLAAAG